MFLRCHLAFALALALSGPLSAAQVAQAGPVSAAAATPRSAGVSLRLRVVDACRLRADGGTSNCATAHQRSDGPVPPPPQVQALTPPIEGGQLPRAWQTITF